jgi:hypothetical protein
MNWDSPATIMQLAALMIFVIVADGLIVTYPAWLAVLPSMESADEKNEPSCLKTSDFFAVHLTTHFATADDGKADPRKKALEYVPYCDKVPGPGQAVFTVDLMEKDARNQSVGLSFFKIDSGGKLALVKALPSSRNPSGVLTMDVPLTERGKYLLEVAFGAARTADDKIKMPILVGK